MSTTTESPFSLTIKVGPNNDLLTGRADTVEEMKQRISELRLLAGAMQGVTQAAPVPHVSAEVDSVATALDNLAAAGVTGTVVSSGATAIEERTDKWGGKYVRGNPDAGSCAHGPRIVKDWNDKSGKARTAFVCSNDSPFGDYKQGKCDLVWPPRR